MHGNSAARHGLRARLAGQPRAAVAAVLAGLVLVGGAAAGLAWASQSGRPAAAVGKMRPVPAPMQQFAAQQAAPPAPAAPPVSLTIPVIGVKTDLTHLRLAADGTLQAPASTTVAGWYTGSPRPGDTGAAVIVGHVDSRNGPAVFFRLRLLRPGEQVYVSRADGSTAVFRVTRVRQYDKSRFPTVSVYGAVPDAELRLITCGGTFDPATGHYLSNVIVFATLITNAASENPPAG